MSRFWSQVVHSLTPYVPGEQPKIAQLIKLNTNENPYPPAPGVLRAIAQELGQDAASLRLYPDPGSDRLKTTLAAHFKVQTTQVFVGNSSDEVLAHVFQALLKQDAPILFPDITYSFYPVYCGLYQIDYQTIPLTAEFCIAPEDYAQPNGGIIFPNPNAPTGRFLPLEGLEYILQQNPDQVVVVDEAYVDFGGISAISLVDRYENLLVVQTLSKSRALAGLRVGFAIGHPSLIEALERVKNSFNSYPLDRLAQVGAQAAIEDEAWFEQTRQAIMNSRSTVTSQLEAMGFEVLPSAANFVFARHPAHDAATLAQGLRAQNIIVRHFKQARIEQFLRITIGTDAECTALLHGLRTLMSA